MNKIRLIKKNDASCKVIKKWDTVVYLPLLLLWAGICIGAPLENWRQPFFNIASEFEHSAGAPSRMFWDNSGDAALFDTSLWIASVVKERNCWMIEPAVSGGVGKPFKESAFFFHGDFFNYIRFNRFTGWQSLDVDSRYKYDSRYPAHVGRTFIGRIEEAALQVDWCNGFIRIGRQKRSWGPFPDRSLILSPNPYSYDAVEWQLFGNFFEFRYLFAPFASRYSSSDSDNGSSRDRYFAAHSLNFIVGKWATFGFTETVLFTREQGMPDLQYINPLSLYSVINTNQEGNGNLMLGFQWNIHPGMESVSFRGQFVLDDFQIDNEVVTDNEPAHWGIDAGLFWKNPLPALRYEHLIKCEYTYASEWLYTVPDITAEQGERYTFIGKSLGLPFIDGSRLRLGATMVPERIGAFGFSVAYAHRGGNTELSKWHDNEHIPGLPFDSDIPVEYRISLSGEALLYFKDYAHLTIVGEPGWVWNKNNRLHEQFEFDPAFSVLLSVHFSNGILRFR